ncbi:MAG: hypothetical protein KDJ88_15360 [Bauldia sp.]|nr:hypothetical protein [Bauldia sp.]
MTSTLPPNTFEGALSVGTFGVIDPTTHRFLTVHLEGTITKTSPFDTVYYKFNIKSSDYSIAAPYYENPGGSSYLVLYDTNRKELADNRANDETYTRLDHVSYDTSSEGQLHYIKVHPSDSSWTTATYSFGIVVFPLIPTDHGGNSPGSGLDIGTLSKSDTQIFGKDSFYTAFGRTDAGGLAPGDPLPVSDKFVADDRDYFDFSVADAGTVTFQVGGKYGGFILHGPAQSATGTPLKQIIHNGDTIHLNKGDYYLEAVDSATTLSGTNVSIRHDDWEVYENYNFSFSLSPDNPFGSGNDVVTLKIPGKVWYAGSGNDKIFGTSGPDTIYGQSGRDKIFGGDSNDILGGGSGKDKLSGGPGLSNVFVFDSALKASNVDRVTDFRPGLDEIWLDKSAFKKLGLGVLPKKAFFSGASIDKAKKDDLIAYSKKSGELAYVAGHAEKVFAILKHSPNHVSHDDFLVIA